MGFVEKLAEPDLMVDYVAALEQRFILRRDLYARQLDDGRYVSVKEPLTQQHLTDHLQGRITLGAYVLDADSRGRFLVLDADDEPDWHRLTALARTLNELECPSYLEESRRGGHLWLFFAEPLAGKSIRSFGRGLLAHFHIAGIELFPKQDRLATGPGSLIRLPFGVHRKTGRRYGFIAADGRPLAPTIREQIHLLAGAETVPEPVLTRFQHHTPRQAVTADYRADGKPSGAIAQPGEDAPVSERIKAAISVHDFVVRYVELDRQGRGLCPFHDDKIASFSVNAEGNFWHCFACGTGGSVIDFWMQLKQCEFKDALSELAVLVLDKHRN